MGCYRFDDDGDDATIMGLLKKICNEKERTNVGNACNPRTRHHRRGDSLFLECLFVKLRIIFQYLLKSRFRGTQYCIFLFARFIFIF
jgi:hypothetical protein